LASHCFESVIGVDIDELALSTARKTFTGLNIEYVFDDCNNLSIVNKEKFDAIISFETLEHLKNYSGFLKNLHEMLIVGGKLIISTPNILVTGHHSKNDWHFHEKEFEAKEFIDLLKNTGFDNIKLMGQKYSLIGTLRTDLRHEINVLRSNPFSRFGMWLQSKLKNRKFEFPLSEKLEDFEIIEYTVKECTQLQKDGPFVLIAVCQK
jgi:SAM-dependent methyltransferase